MDSLMKGHTVPLSHSRYTTYCTAVFSVNKAEKLWCPELFHKKGPSLPSDIGKASAREFSIPRIWVFSLG